jgi:hypothetical protein
MNITLKSTRAEARANGDKHYFTGQPCKRGHIAKRVVSTSNCCTCMRENHFTYYPANKDKYLQVIKEWSQANPEHVAAASQRYREANPTAASAASKRWYVSNRERKLRENRLWRQLNKAVVQQYGARRRAQIRQAMPAWANIGDIVAVYKESVRITQETGIQHHVDHIVPLGGKNVCGLHVWWNLQILTGQENMRKGNAFSSQWALDVHTNSSSS